MDPQVPARRSHALSPAPAAGAAESLSTRRGFVLVTAVAAAGAVLSSCAPKKGMQRAAGGGSQPAGTLASGAGAAGQGAAAKPSDADAPKQAPEQPKGPIDATATTTKPQPAPIDRPAPPSGEPSIRIKTGGLPKTSPSVRIDGPGAKMWVVDAASGAAGRAAVTPVELALTPTGWRMTEGAGKRWARASELGTRGAIEISAMRGEPRRVSMLGSEWPGTVRLVPQPASAAEAVDIVHEVPLEEYLSGVIAKELYNSWAPATHRAQAVAARSYALCSMAMYGATRHYDVLSDERSQAWIGATTHRKSLDAVAATRGQVLLFQGLVVPAYYSSCCGGASASAQGTIESPIRHDIAPLAARGRDRDECCSISPNYRWQNRVDAGSFSRTLPAWARVEGYPLLAGVGAVQRVTVAQRNAAGRPTRYGITDARGQEYEVEAERLRWAFNADPANPAAMRPFKERVKSAYFEPLVAGGEIVLTGRGFGHGVGMCQFGAEGMARKGAKSEAILARYYPSATLARAYG
ncbi:MAG: SpoIID/LytB domain-containing protein [Planctomycetota bacterium]